MGLPQASPLFPVLYNIYTKGLANLNINGLKWVLTLADDGLIYKTASDINKAGHRCPRAAGKDVTLVPGDRFRNQPKQSAVLRCTFNSKAVGHRCQQSPSIEKVTEGTNSLRQLGIHFDRNVDANDPGRINKTQVQERTVRVESHGSKRHR